MYTCLFSGSLSSDLSQVNPFIFLFRVTQTQMEGKTNDQEQRMNKNEHVFLFLEVLTAYLSKQSMEDF